jgi:hypothetical protein
MHPIVSLLVPYGLYNKTIGGSWPAAFPAGRTAWIVSWLRCRYGGRGWRGLRSVPAGCPMLELSKEPEEAQYFQVQAALCRPGGLPTLLFTITPPETPLQLFIASGLRQHRVLPPRMGLLPLPRHVRRLHAQDVPSCRATTDSSPLWSGRRVWEGW